MPVVLLLLLLDLALFPPHPVASIQSWEVNERSQFTSFGDILLTPAQSAKYGGPLVRGVNVRLSEDNRWPNERIPFVLSSDYSTSQEATLRDAIRRLNLASCVKFVEHSTEADFLYIQPLDGCYSFVGRIGGRQQMSLAVDCLEDYIIWHELLHVVGFEHEHQRPDRDVYIEVRYENVIPGQIGNFEKLSEDAVETQDQYDYSSIMHYEGHAFGRRDPTSRVRMATMIPKKSDVQLVDNMQLSPLDVQRLNRIGNCAVSQQNPDTNSIVHDNGGNHIMTAPHGNSRNATIRTCRDRGLWCAASLCQHPFYRRPSSTECRATCKTCGESGGSTDKSQQPRTCVDTANCSEFARLGRCTIEKYAKVATRICPKTCRLCRN